jgi:hypothetical protein
LHSSINLHMSRLMSSLRNGKFNKAPKHVFWEPFQTRDKLVALQTRLS